MSKEKKINVYDLLPADYPRTTRSRYPSYYPESYGTVGDNGCGCLAFLIIILDVIIGLAIFIGCTAAVMSA